MALRTIFNPSFVDGLCAAPHAVVSPVKAFSSRRDSPQPGLTLIVVVLLTTIAANASNPITMYILRTTPEISASAGLAKTFVLLQGVVLTPFGTAILLLAMATTVWTTSLVVGADPTFREVAFVVFVAGVASVLKRLFVTLVLYLRWWLRPGALGNEITTGLDGFITERTIGSLPAAILREAGLFELWFLALLAVGLQYAARLPRTTALLVSGVNGFILIGAKVALNSFNA